MTKILVDEMPKEAKDCPFGEYIRMTDKTDCTLQHGIYNTQCNLEYGMECKYLVELRESWFG